VRWRSLGLRNLLPSQNKKGGADSPVPFPLFSPASHPGLKRRSEKKNEVCTAPLGGGLMPYFFAGRTSSCGVRGVNVKHASAAIANLSGSLPSAFSTSDAFGAKR
jgi:hypothetical protein